MGFLHKDRVMETLQSGFTGTGTYSLGGAVTGARTFVAGFATGNPCRYVARKIDWSKWEIGWGVVTDATPDTLTRVDIDASFDGASYGTSKIDWAASDTVIIYSGAEAGSLDGERLIDEASLTSVASYIKDSIPSVYNFLRLDFSTRPATDATALSLLLRKSSGTDITSYDRSVLFTVSSAATGSNALAQSSAVLGTNIENTSPQGIHFGSVWIYNIQSSDHKGIVWIVGGFTDAGALAPVMGSAKANDTAAITGVKLIEASGNIAAGRARLVGY